MACPRYYVSPSKTLDTFLCGKHIKTNLDTFFGENAAFNNSNWNRLSPNNDKISEMVVIKNNLMIRICPLHRRLHRQKSFTILKQNIYEGKEFIYPTLSWPKTRGFQLRCSSNSLFGLKIPITSRSFRSNPSYFAVSNSLIYIYCVLFTSHVTYPY